MTIKTFHNAIILALCLITFRIEASTQTDHLLQEAYNSYVAGEKATTISDRKKAFNLSLSIYTELEKIDQPTFGNGKLYYNIGNSYFQLEEYPWAILYYNKALKLNPRNDAIQQNLTTAQQKAGLSSATFLSLYDQVFFFHTKLALPERLQLFFAFGMIVLVVISTWIWHPQRWQKSTLVLFGICSLIMFCSVCYTRYFSPIEGVIVESTPLYRDAGKQYATASELPILSGNKIRVLVILENGQWLKVMAPNGDLGYVPHTAIRII